MRDIIGEIRQELKSRVDKEYKEGASKYFKEEVKILGVRTPDVRKVARMYFPIISELSKEEILDMCEVLLAGDYFEEKTIAIEWAFRLRDQYRKGDFERFKKWLLKYVGNWAHCDDLCTHVVGVILSKYPDLVGNVVEKWTKSKNRWLRRGAAVSLIYLVRRGNNLKNVFLVSDRLMKDNDDLVQKGLGWLLRETADRYPSDIYRYLVKNKEKLARVTLRYAIEKMPKGQKQELMKKEEKK